MIKILRIIFGGTFALIGIQFLSIGFGIFPKDSKAKLISQIENTLEKHLRKQGFSIDAIKKQFEIWKQ